MESKKGKGPILIQGIGTQRDKPRQDAYKKKEGLEGPPPPFTDQVCNAIFAHFSKGFSGFAYFRSKLEGDQKTHYKGNCPIWALSSYQQSLSVISLCNDHNYTFLEPIMGTLFAFNTRVCYLLKLLVIFAIDGLSFTNAYFFAKILHFFLLKRSLPVVPVFINPQNGSC